MKPKESKLSQKSRQNFKHQPRLQNDESGNSINLTLAARVKKLRPELSWNQVRSLIAGRYVTVDGTVVLDHATRFDQDAAIEIFSKPAARNAHKNESDAEPTKKTKQKTAIFTSDDIKILFADHHIVVVEKPSGLESVPFSTKDSDGDSETSRTKSKLHGKNQTLVEITRVILKKRESGQIPPLRIVHRIDKGTSGIVVFARSKLAERELAKQFKDHSITRAYEAIVTGVPKNQTITSYLVPDRGDGKRGSIAPSLAQKTSSSAKRSVTHIKTLESWSEENATYSRIECTLETGRTHQIRIHMCELGHPLCGDKVYRSPKVGKPAIADESGAKRLMLHAKILGFKHPVSGESLHFQSEESLKRSLSDNG